MLAEITHVPVQPNKAITGRNAFAHEAGIHQDGVIKNPLTYEIMTPQSVGVPDSKLVLGKHSGRHALAIRCEQLGHKFERRELDEVYRKFVVLADRIKRVQDGHLLELIEEVTNEAKRIPPAGTGMPQPRAASAVAGDAHPVTYFGHSPSGAVPAPSISFADHHAEQEDYLWGV
jgi:2-isopropylmalate synthase